MTDDSIKATETGLTIIPGFKEQLREKETMDEKDRAQTYAA
jgi:hypothetical protein